MNDISDLDMDLVEEIEQLDSEQQRRNEADRLDKIKAFAKTLISKRKEAIDGRKNSGIEAIWQGDDDHYDGVDEMNRGEGLIKSTSPTGSPFYANPSSPDDVRSNVFVNITQPYVDMGAARVADMLLPTDDKPFKLKPTPVPDLDRHMDSQEIMPGGNGATVGQAAKAFMTEATAKADLAETQIWDWLVESNWHSEVRKVIEQASRIGTGCLKGPFPKKVKRRKILRENGEVKLVVDIKINPSFKHIDVYNLYPDPSCGNNIHNGDYIFEKDRISARQLRDLIGVDGYIDSEIHDLIKEGPSKKNIDDKGVKLDSDQYEIWYYTGNADSKDMIAAGCDCEENTQVPVVVVMVDDRVIKASLSVLDSGDFPYDVMVWQRRTNHWAGLGISRQVRTSQRVVNAATRNMLDNAGVAAGPQIIMRGGVVSPADGVWTVTPMKLWYVDEDADIQNVEHAFTAIQIPMMQQELENIVKMGMEFAERATSMPLLMQGAQGNSTDTVGGMTILDRNASSVLRRIAKISDDDLTEPVITRAYEWLMLYGEDDSMKGDMSIISLGSSAFYERDAQNQAIMQMLPLSKDPSYNLDPSKLMTEVLKMNKISPERVMLTDQQIKERQQALQAHPPVDPRISGQIEVAKVRTQGDLQKAQMVQQSDQAEIAAKGQLAQSEMALKIKLSQEQMAHDKEMLNMQLQLEMMKLSQSSNQSLDTIKAALAQTSMKLSVQKQLSELSVNSDHAKQDKDHLHTLTTQAMAPPTEPAGRAENGAAFQQ